MLRLAALTALTAMLVGCKSPQTYENPFMGRTTIPPPGTALPGAMPGAYDPNAGVAPAFNPNAAVPAAAPPATLFPPAGATTPPPAGAPQYQPPGGGYDFRQTQTNSVPVFQTNGAPMGPAPAVIHRNPSTTSPSAARWGNGSAAAQTFDPNVAQVGAVALTADAASRNSGTSAPSLPQSSAARDPREPGRLPPNDAIDIMDLPPADSAVPGKGAEPTVKQTTFHQQLNRIGTGPAETAPRPATTNHASYGHDANYVWLKGKLEYSNIDRRWKLRYIPIDGETDAHGGSVVLPDSALLEGFASGDFVAVQGAISGEASSGFAPQYDVTRVKRLE